MRKRDDKPEGDVEKITQIGFTAFAQFFICNYDWKKMKAIIKNKSFIAWCLFVILIINNTGTIHASLIKTCVDGEVQSSNASCICSYSSTTKYSTDGNATSFTSPIMCTEGQSCSSSTCKTINCQYCSACSSDATTCLSTCDNTIWKSEDDAAKPLILCLIR